MRLEGAERATIEAAKVRDYLLSPFHPGGRSKAAFFRSMGYSIAEWEVLAHDLKRHALENDARPGTPTVHGRKFEIRGTLHGPSGRPFGLLAVWIVLDGEHTPRFVTAMPRTHL